jgi:plasmid stabilization system protein ParE
MDHIYDVRLTDEAVIDLEQAVGWIKEDSIEAARVFFDAIRLKINNDLSQTPHMGVMLQMIDGHDLMALTCGQYRAFYVVDDELHTVSIIRLLHTSRDIRSILKLAA